MNGKGLVIDLQYDIINNSNNTTDLLRRAHLIASKLGLQEFDEWIMKELNGYDQKDLIPEYRSLIGECKAFNPYRGWIPVVINNYEIEKSLCTKKIANPISELTILTSKDEDLIIQLSGEIQKTIMSGSNNFMQCAIHVTNASVKTIIEHVKNTLLEWTLRLEKENILGMDLKFNKNEIENAKNVPQTINNYYNNITNIYSPKNVNSNINGNDNVFNYDEQEINIEELKKIIANEISDKNNLKKSLKMLEDIKNTLNEKSDKQTVAAAWKNVKEFLLKIGASLSAKLIQSKLGV